MSYDFLRIEQEILLPSPLQSFRFSFWKPTIYIKRDDLIHPKVSGNKWRKLKGMVEWSSDHDIQRWISFGGPFSNHVLALSHMAHWCNVQLTCYIRGENHVIKNPTLQEAKRLGTDIRFVPRHEYRNFVNTYQNNDTKTLVVPEGGSHKFCHVGLKELMDELKTQVDLRVIHSLWVGCGTGGTIGGIMKEKPKKLTCYTLSAVNDKSIPKRIRQIAGNNMDENLSIIFPKKSMGYRKLSDRSISFMRKIYQESGIKLDPIYTIKLFNQIDKFIQKHKLDTSDNLLIIHTGGLQGIAGYEYIHNQIIYT